MKRLKAHRDSLNRILADVRISGNRRLLGQFLACWLDAEGEEKDFVQTLMQAVWVSAAKTRWVDEDEAAVTEPQGNLEKQTVERLKNAFAEVLGETNATVQSS